MGRDWFFRDETGICNFRVAGLLLRGDKILLQRERGGNEYAVPGGHVRSDETSAQSLVREYMEETGAEIVCERLIWVEEAFWKWSDANASTLTFYYLVRLADKADISDDYSGAQRDNDDVVIEWIRICDLKKLTVYPSFLVEKIENISNSIEHFISS